MNFPLKTGLAAALLSVAAGSHLSAQQIRFQGMDRNRDRVITRQEWQGNDQAFRNEDWNGDGILSGDEVRPGARKPASARDNDRDLNNDGVVNQQDALISRQFVGYDRNRDGRVTQDEWRAAAADTALFSRLDVNRDRALTLAEYGAGGNSTAEGGPRYQFTNIDRNRDGWITRNEWNIDEGDFTRLDTNRDNRISQYEFQSYSNVAPPSAANGRFTTLDANRDGQITWNEWRGTEGDYVRLDTNGDGHLAVAEFDANPQAANRFAALDANHDGWLTREEWKWSDGSYYRMDTSSDNRLSRTEFQTGLANTLNRVQADEQDSNGRWNNGRWNRNNDNQSVQRNRSAQAGYDRGLNEGRQAGREDKANGRAWDLDGQTELERADSGYYSQLGTLGDYQGGYRDGFRFGYREGFGQR